MGALNAAGITTVQNYPGLELKGQGMLIGFLDTGIDYPNPVFRSLDGSTRILGIWDQTIQDGNPPEGFCYGSAYTREDINKALQQEDPFAFVPTKMRTGMEPLRQAWQQEAPMWRTSSWGLRRRR